MKGVAQEEERRTAGGKMFRVRRGVFLHGCFIFIGPQRIYLVDYLEILRGIFNLYTGRRGGTRLVGANASGYLTWDFNAGKYT